LGLTSLARLCQPRAGISDIYFFRLDLGFIDTIKGYIVLKRLAKKNNNNNNNSILYFNLCILFCVIFIRFIGLYIGIQPRQPQEYYTPEIAFCQGGNKKNI